MARRMQKNSQKSRNSITHPLQQFCPAVSVIIPMYNAEKYIGECLDSILAQTFTNFEVIVVDDCSTDNSPAIVESYIPKFDGRLKLSHMKKNSGNAALPRNKGLVLSQGEYIYFMDSDDWIAPTALEELYTLAKKFDADVLYGERHFETDEDGKNARLVSRQFGKVVDQPTLETEDLKERVQILLQKDIFGPPWNELVRRDVLVENEIVFPEVRPGDDHIWALNLFFSTKKFLRVPTVSYFWRQTDTSLTRVQKTPQKYTTLWLTVAIMGLKCLDEILSRIKFFEENFQYRYAVLNYLVERKFKLSFHASLQLPPFEVYRAIKQEFGDKLGEYDVLVSALCTLINTQQKMFAVNQQKFNEFAAQAQKRIAELEAQLKNK